MMKNAVSDVVTSLQKEQQSNATEASLFPNFGSVNVSASTQELTNQVTQVLNTLCSANIDQVQTDIMIFAKDSSTGNISFVQNGNAVANCVMQNAAIAQLNSQQQGTQNNTIGGFGLGGIIGLVIVLAIILIVAGVAKKASRGNDNSQGGGYQQQQQQQAPSSNSGGGQYYSRTTRGQ